ncbi:class I SAM-dependent methyltransferase [Campylobacter showae]|uniref:Methyltransferase domain-containing protein n=1 Tax=Campylobacter showae CC57C TaxID=1073353 RepID=M3IL67_9BACT|nr:class I SAM-dependent methyltransferase [Campylobacter showae]EMG30866.1 methyltransferase domain-containing protein [Campylobacter showae CC57C]
MILPSNYDEIDFDALYKAQKAKSSFGKKLAEHWDKKAPSFNEGVMKSVYAQEFIDKVDFTGVSTLLDFACGAGALSVLAEEKVDQIYGYDFSPRMLEFARENAQTYGAKNAKFAQKAFEDDWSDVPECDVVFASRCLEVDDLKAALSKLLSKTKKALYITFKVGGSFVDEDVLGAIGRKVEQKPDFVYLLNILFQMGYLPSLDYIKARCHAGPASSAEELIQKTRWGLGGELSEAEEARLAEYFNSGKYKPGQEFMHWAVVRGDKANRS